MIPNTSPSALLLILRVMANTYPMKSLPAALNPTSAVEGRGGCNSYAVGCKPILIILVFF
jgi:hypothetical protein